MSSEEMKNTESCEGLKSDGTFESLGTFEFSDSSETSAQKKKERWLGIDLLRTLSFLAIVIFHTANAVFPEGAPYENWRGTFFEWQQIYARLIPFSGFTIVAIHSFLFGLKSQPTASSRWKWIFLGSVILFLSYGNPLEGDFFWEWDIYQYLIFAFLALFVCSKWRFSFIPLFLTSFLFLWVPFWKFPSEFLPEVAKHALVGVCDGEGRGGWPLLPWIGLPVFFFSWGKLQSRLSLGSKELFLWGFLFLCAVPFWGSYFSVDTGKGFYCFIFRQEPWIFWAHFLWIAVFLRWAVVRPQDFQFRPVAWVSRWKMNSKFVWAYLVHLVLIQGVMGIAPWVGENPGFFSFLPLLLFVMVEVLLRMGQRLRFR